MLGCERDLHSASGSVFDLRQLSSALPLSLEEPVTSFKRRFWPQTSVGLYRSSKDGLLRRFQALVCATRSHATSGLCLGLKAAQSSFHFHPCLLTDELIVSSN